jgi:hypothetical protein
MFLNPQKVTSALRGSAICGAHMVYVLQSFYGPMHPFYRAVRPLDCQRWGGGVAALLLEFLFVKNYVKELKKLGPPKGFSTFAQ